MTQAEALREVERLVRESSRNEMLKLVKHLRAERFSQAEIDAALDAFIDSTEVAVEESLATVRALFARVFPPTPTLH